jgi:cardiolipin synthase
MTVLLAGCQAPPGFEPGDFDLPRGMALARQLVTDSTLETAGHPLRTLAAAVVQTADSLCGASRGIVGKRVLLRLRRLPGPVEPCRPALDDALLEANLKKLTRRDLEPAQVILYQDGCEALGSLLQLIDDARLRIDVIMFIWANDDVGRTIAEHIAARAAAGVPVRVLIDGGGNLINADSDDMSVKAINGTVSWLAHQPNVQVVRVRDGWARFDHRKLVIADGQLAWTGGRNFRDQAFGQQHDLSLTVAGSLVAQLSGEFERSWKHHGGRVVAPDEGGAAPGVPCEVCCENVLARLVGTGPLRHDLADALACAIDQARHHIYVENPYLSDSRFILRLVRARRRGVDVRAVLTLDSGEALANRANRVTANFLLRAGVRVYLHDGATHVKALSVDGAWAYVGTGNFDPLSLRHDHELGLALSGGPLIQEIEEEILAPDFRPEWELTEPLPVTPADRLSEVITCLFG